MPEVRNPKAWIFTIGNEILIGRIVNTNASWLAQNLTFMGFEVERIIVVPDRIDDIKEEIERALGRARLIVTTGGLGPTYDDLTLEGIAAATGRRLVLNEKAKKIVERFYSQRSLPLTEERLKMAKLPEGSEPLENPVGAAPGVWLEHNGTVIVALPGVPAEMKGIFELIRDRISSLAPPRYVVECGVKIVGVPESSIAPYLKKVIKGRPNVYLKSHPMGHEIRGPILVIKALVSDESKEAARKTAREVISEVAKAAKTLGGSIEWEEPC